MTAIEPLSYEYFLKTIKDDSSFEVVFEKLRQDPFKLDHKIFCTKFQGWIDHQVQHLASQTVIQPNIQVTDSSLSTFASKSILKCASLYAVMIFRQYIAVESAQRSLVVLLKTVILHPTKQIAFDAAHEKTILISANTLCDFLHSVLTQLLPILPYFGISFLQLVLSHPQLATWQHRKVLEDYVELELPATMQTSSGVNLRKLLSMSNKSFHGTPENRLDFTSKNDKVLFNEREKYYEEFCNLYQKFSYHFDSTVRMHNVYVNNSTSSSVLKLIQANCEALMRDFCSSELKRLQLMNSSYAADLFVQMYLHYSVHIFVAVPSAVPSSSAVVGNNNNNNSNNSTQFQQVQNICNNNNNYEKTTVPTPPTTLMVKSKKETAQRIELGTIPTSVAISQQPSLSSPKPTSSAISNSSTPKISLLEERIQKVDTRSTARSTAKRITPTPAISSTVSPSSSTDPNIQRLHLDSGSTQRVSNDGDRKNSFPAAAATTTTTNKFYDAKRMNHVPSAFHGNNNNNDSSPPTLEDTLFPNHLLFFCQFVSHCNNTNGNFLHYVQHSILQAIESQISSTQSSSVSIGSHSETGHFDTRTFLSVNGTTGTGNTTNITSSVFYEDYDVFVLTIQKLKSLGRLLGYIQFLPYGLQQTKSSVEEPPTDSPFPPTTSSNSPLIPLTMGMQLPLLNALDACMISTSHDSFLPTLTWIVEFLTLISFIVHPHYKKYYCTMYRDVFQRLYTIHKEMILFQEGGKTDCQKIRSEHEMYIVILLQSFWDHFPEIFGHFALNGDSKQQAPYPVAVSTKRTPNRQSWNDFFDSSNSCSGRLYLTEFCWHYLLPSLYGVYSAPVLTKVGTVKGSSVLTKQSNPMATTKEEVSRGQSLVTMTNLVAKPKDKSKTHRIVPAAIKGEPSTLPSMELLPLSEASNVKDSGGTVVPSSLTVPPPFTPPAAVTRKSVNPNKASASANSSTTSTPRKSRTPLSATNNIPVNEMMKLISPTKSFSYANVNKLPNGSSVFGARDSQPANLRLPLFDQEIPESAALYVPDFFQGNKLYPTLQLTPTIPPITSTDLLQSMEEAFWNRHRDFYDICVFMYRTSYRSCTLQCKEYVNQGFHNLKDRIKETYVQHLRTHPIMPRSTTQVSKPSHETKVTLEALFQHDYDHVYKQVLTQCRDHLHTFLSQHNYHVAQDTNHLPSSTKSLYEYYFKSLTSDPRILQLANYYSYQILLTASIEIYQNTISYTARKLKELLNSYEKVIGNMHTIRKHIVSIQWKTKDVQLNSAGVDKVVDSDAIERPESEHTPPTIVDKYWVPLIQQFVKKEDQDIMPTSEECDKQEHYPYLLYDLALVVNTSSSSSLCHMVTNDFHYTLQLFRNLFQEVSEFRDMRVIAPLRTEIQENDLYSVRQFITQDFSVDPVFVLKKLLMTFFHSITMLYERLNFSPVVVASSTSIAHNEPSTSPKIWYPNVSKIQSLQLLGKYTCELQKFLLSLFPYLCSLDMQYIITKSNNVSGEDAYKRSSHLQYLTDRSWFSIGYEVFALLLRTKILTISAFHSLLDSLYRIKNTAFMENCLNVVQFGRQMPHYTLFLIGRLLLWEFEGLKDMELTKRLNEAWYDIVPNLEEKISQCMDSNIAALVKLVIDSSSLTVPTTVNT